MQFKRSLRKNRRGVSPAISMVIITAVTAVLVMVSGMYALQVLQGQRATAEFDAVQKSVLAFDDAVRDIAWEQGGSRSIRFTNSYGNMRLIDSVQSYEITLSGFDYDDTLYEFTTAAVKYQMPYGYGLTGIESSYILGNESVAISTLTDSLGQVLVREESGLTSINLNYRVRVSEVGSMEVQGTIVNYVYIFVLKLSSANSTVGASDFDLVCKNVGLETITRGPFAVNGLNPGVLVTLDGDQSSFIPLNDGNSFIFNIVIADVGVSY